jgi:hypothetical protein
MLRARYAVQFEGLKTPRFTSQAPELNSAGDASAHEATPRTIEQLTINGLDEPRVVLIHRLHDDDAGDLFGFLARTTRDPADRDRSARMPGLERGRSAFLFSLQVGRRVSRPGVVNIPDVQLFERDRRLGTLTSFEGRDAIEGRGTEL